MNAIVACEQAAKWNGAKKKIRQPRSQGSIWAERDGGGETQERGELSNYDVKS